MLTLSMARKTIDYLRRPFIQRLITLLISTILAMSLLSTLSVPALPPSGHEMASSLSKQFASVAHLDVARIQNLMQKTQGQDETQATKQYDRERRLV